jgi:hypothetical protein
MAGNTKTTTPSKVSYWPKQPGPPPKVTQPPAPPKKGKS